PEADVLAEKQRGGGILTPEVRPESAKYGLRAQKQQLQRRWLRQVAENFICVRACLVFDCLKQVSGSPLMKGRISASMFIDNGILCV
ncbi:hypothetical protein, partial [Chromobacterium haemolyticum]|uniref:hypothetical protein n=1 Tax=Chromobacterium haemolyticum TaxID=394935 RepID=UPI001C393182